MNRKLTTGCLCLLLFGSDTGWAQNPSDGDGEGRLRLKAGFEQGKAELDLAPGEKRLSRIWSGSDGRKAPDSAKSGRLALSACLGAGHQSSYSFLTGADAGFQSTGALNLQAGSVAGWVKLGDLVKNGGLLLTAEAYPTGGPIGSIHWALGIGGPARKEVPAGKLFFIADGVQCIAENPLPEGEWVHLTAVWDAEQGAKLYANGQLLASHWSQKKEGSAKKGNRIAEFPLANFSPLIRKLSPYPVERFHLFPQNGGAVDDLEVFDFPLNAQGVHELYEGREPDYSLAEKFAPDAAWRLSRLGWTVEGNDGFISVETGKPLSVKQAVVLTAKENKRACGWFAVDGFPASRFPWWYHGYTQGIQKQLHLTFEEGTSINYITAYGDLTGTLGESVEEPASAANALLSIQPDGLYFRRRLEKPIAAQRLTLKQQKGSLSEIGFYSISPGEAQKSGGELAYDLQPLGKSESPLTGIKRDEFISVYRPGDRLTLVGVPAGEGKGGGVSIPALEACHLMTPRLASDFSLGSIGLNLQGRSAAASTRLRLVAHDAFNPWRELARLDFVVKNTGKPDFDLRLNLDLRDTLIRKGDVVWLTLTADAPMEIASGPGETGSSLVLFPAKDAAKAIALWRDWELNSVRDRLESLSEPRPWGLVGDDPQSSWWLAASTPEYEWLDHSLRELYKRFPQDDKIRAYFSYTHPEMPDLAASLPLPPGGADPRWAVLLKENLHLYRQFLGWWIAHRQEPNGEWGNWYGDDTDLVQDWLDAALISDPDGRIAQSLRNTADGVWNRFKLKHGEPVITNGLNTRWTDLLHAYEEGLNVQPQTFLLDYGDPEILSRLMATAARYDGFLMTPASGGERHFAGAGKGMAFVSSTRPPEGDSQDRAAYLMTYPGLVISWYNRHPATLEALREFGNGSLKGTMDQLSRSQATSLSYLSYGGAPFYTGLFELTGEKRFLAPLLEHPLSKEDSILAPKKFMKDYNLFQLLEGYDREKSFDLIHRDAATRYDTLGTTMLGGGDSRYLKSWTEWYLTRDKSHLVTALEHLYRRLKFTMPLLTEAEQSGDRVAIPKQLISQMYLGGVPAARNNFFYPYFATSYRGLSEEFAALVLQNKTDELEVLFYNFEEKPQKGEMKVWNLLPGKYKMTAGPDADQDDRMDKVEFEGEFALERGAGVPLELPSKKVWTVRLQLLEKSTPLEERVDAGISSRLLRREGSTLVVPVFNTGEKPIPRLVVRLRSADGKQREDRVVENLGVDRGWTLPSQDVKFTIGNPPGNGSWSVELDPERELQEITRNNNRTEFSAQSR